MFDLCIMRYRKLASIATVDLLRVAPTFLKVTGHDMDRVVEVRLNQDWTSEYQVVSQSELRVAVPAFLENSAITDVAVYVDATDTDGSDYMELRLTQDTRSGLARLCQMVVKLLFTTPGSDIFDQADGGGLQTLFTGDVSITDIGAVTGLVARATDDVRKVITARQRGRGLPAEDTLLDLRLLGVSVDVGNQRVAITLRVVSRSGIADFTVPLESQGEG